MSARHSCRCRLCRSRARLTIERPEHREANGRAIQNPRYVRTNSAFGGLHRESIVVSESRPDSPVGNVLVHYRRSEIEFPRDGSAAWRRAQARIKSLRPSSKPQPLMKRTTLNLKDSPLPFLLSTASWRGGRGPWEFASSREITVIRLSSSPPPPSLTLSFSFSLFLFFLPSLVCVLKRGVESRTICKGWRWVVHRKSAGCNGCTCAYGNLPSLAYLGGVA